MFTRFLRLGPILYLESIERVPLSQQMFLGRMGTIKIIVVGIQFQERKGRKTFDVWMEFTSLRYFSLSVLSLSDLLRVDKSEADNSSSYMQQKLR